MFYVVHQETGTLRKVYGMNGTSFMFWNEEEGAWEYDHIKYYRPWEG